MRLTVDFTTARVTSCHCYVGVRARVDDGPERIITITPDGCTIRQIEGQTLPCELPHIETNHAWSIAMLLTGQECSEPKTGSWDSDRRVITFPIGRSNRMMMD